MCARFVKASSNADATKRAFKGAFLLPKNIQSTLTRRANNFRRKPTLAELRMEQLLIQLNFPFKSQSPRWSRNTYRIFDFYIPYVQINIEVDGGYHNPEKDKWKDYFLKQARPNMQTLRFTNEEVFTNPEKVMTRIKYLVEHSPRFNRLQKRRNGAYGFVTGKTDPRLALT